MGLKLEVPKRFGKKRKPNLPSAIVVWMQRMSVRLKNAYVPRRSWVSAEQFRRTLHAPGIETMEATAFFDMLRDRKKLWIKPWRLDYFETLAYILFPRPEEKILACVLIWTLRDRFAVKEIAGFLEARPYQIERMVKYVLPIWENFVCRGPLSSVDDVSDLLDPDDLVELVAREEAGSGNAR